METVIQERHIIGNVQIKVMADGGQGFFKMCMTVLPENYVPELDCRVNNPDSEIDLNLLTMKRTLYSD